MMEREILTEARALIARGWTQGQLACDHEREPVHVMDADACGWCALGAIRKAQAKVGEGEPVQFILKALNAGPADSREDWSQNSKDTLLTVWNDMPERTQADVLAVFDRAIALAGGRLG